MTSAGDFTRGSGVQMATAPSRPTLLPGLMSSASVQWMTPINIVDRVVRAFGRIDLDPSAEPAMAIPARLHFTAEQDGLARPWVGRTYLNPPYGRAIGRWIDKLVTERLAGNVTEAIVLVPARTDTQWFHQIPTEVICFVKGRLRFSGSGPAPFPSAVAYVGDDPRAFIGAFEDLGMICWMTGIGTEGRSVPTITTSHLISQLALFETL